MTYILYAMFALLMCLYLHIFVQFIIYKRSRYYQETHTSFLKVYFDKGLYGEYRTYLQLKNISGKPCFLFNVYVPKENKETVEIDCIMIHETGIYVFESKNYSGWIFGNETRRKWTQVLNKSKKTYFFNPILQNNVHIKWLKNLIKEEIPFYSYIVFSERCTLKKIDLKSNQHVVIKRNQLLKEINTRILKSTIVLNSSQIQNIYKLLSLYTNVSDSTKKEHIEVLQNKYY